MFRAKRDDTTVGTIERTYNIRLNARSDMQLGNLLEERGFDSLTQFLKAYRGQLTTNARRRRVFLSFHAEDKQQVSGFRLMINNSNVNLDLYDLSLRAQVESENQTYIRSVIREKIRSASVTACLIGNGTAWRDFVDWELRTAHELGKGICGIRLRESRGRTPPLLKEINAPIAKWDVSNIVATIECASARRS